MPLLLNVLSVPPPITMSLTPSPLRSLERGDENVEIESAKACQFCARMLETQKNKISMQDNFFIKTHFNKCKITQFYKN